MCHLAVSCPIICIFVALGRINLADLLALQKSLLHAGTSNQQAAEFEQIPDPPSAAAAVGLMGFGGEILSLLGSQLLKHVVHATAIFEYPLPVVTLGLLSIALHPYAALGAVAVAAVGVYGVLQISLMVAQGTGRSIMAEKQAAEPAEPPEKKTNSKP